MAARVFLLGALTSPGRLAAEAMVRAGLGPVLTGRRADDLVALTGDLAGLGPMAAPPSWAVADATDPHSIAALVDDPRDVLVSTVGAFARRGWPAVDAALTAGCGYVDAAAEPAFIRGVFDAPSVEGTGARLLPGLDGARLAERLAAAIAVAQARERGNVPAAVGIRHVDRSHGHRPLRIRAQVYDPVGRVVGRGEVVGPVRPEVTAQALAWAVSGLASGRVHRRGALTVVEAFGLPAVRTACAAMGLRVVEGAGEDAG